MSAWSRICGYINRAPGFGYGNVRDLFINDLHFGFVWF